MKEKQNTDEKRIEEKRAHVELMAKHNEGIALKKQEGTSIN